MSLCTIYGSQMPLYVPGSNSNNVSTTLHIPPYFRVDWGNTIQLLKFDAIKSWRMFHNVKDVNIGLEVFNLFNYRNVISYLWVSDYEGHPFRVPNYLTSRQLNVKLTVVF